MAEEPAVPPVVERIPSTAGEISGVASANAPFIYFESALFYGHVNGIGKVALTSSRQIAQAAAGGVLSDHVIVAHLVGNLPAIRALRAALDGILLMAEPPPEGPSN
jgi:hypothetical protein